MGKFKEQLQKYQKVIIVSYAFQMLESK